jgi:hypothetical protein
MKGRRLALHYKNTLSLKVEVEAAMEAAEESVERSHRAIEKASTLTLPSPSQKPTFRQKTIAETRATAKRRLAA